MLQSPLNKTASPQAHSYITLKKIFTIEKLNLTWNKETCFIKLPSAPPLQKKKKKKKKNWKILIPPIWLRTEVGGNLRP